VAWHRLGWKPAFFSEVEAFPSTVLAHHYPNVPNWGDMTKFQEWPDAADIDVLVGGTPCQSFSVAGLRAGLDDPRGNLMLTFASIARRYRPRWLVWENVPGVLSSDGGRDFASLLGVLSGRAVVAPSSGFQNCGVVPGIQRAYGLAWRVLDAQYVRVDSHPRAVPQRRRRVFVVGYLGNWHPAAAVLSEPEGLSGNPPPRREARKGASGTLSARTKGGGGLGTDFDLAGGIVPEVCGCISDGAHNGGGLNGQDAYTGRIIPTVDALRTRRPGDRPPGTDVDTANSLIPTFATPAIGNIVESDVASCITKNTGGGGETQNPAFILDAVAHTLPVTIPIQNATRGQDQNGLGIGGDVMFTLDQGSQHAVAHPLRAEGFDASKDGTGRGTPLVTQVMGRQIPIGIGGSDLGFALRASHSVDKGDGGMNTNIVIDSGVCEPHVIAFDTTQITSTANHSNPKSGDPCHPLAAGAHPPAIAFETHHFTLIRDNEMGGAPAETVQISATGAEKASDTAPHVPVTVAVADTLGVGANQTTGFASEVCAMAFAQNTRDEVRLQGGDGQIVGALAAQPGMKQTTYVAFTVKDHGANAGDTVEGTLYKGTSGKDAGGTGQATTQPVAFEPGKMQRLGYGMKGDGTTPTLRSASGDNQLAVALMQPITFGAQMFSDVGATLKGGSGERGYPDPSDGNGHNLVAQPVPITFAARMSFPQTDVDLAQTLQAENQMAVMQPVAIQGTIIGRSENAGPCGGGTDTSGAMFTLTKTDVHAVSLTPGDRQPVAPSLTASNDPSRSPQSSEVTQQVTAVHSAIMQVRRLTPVECERLQGFPDGYTNIPWRQKAESPDGPRYKALGNSMAVNVMSWIGERINRCDSIMKTKTG